MLLRIAILAISFGLVLGTSSHSDAKTLNVKIHFSYDKTPLRIELYDVNPLFKYSIAKTVITSDIKTAPLQKKISSSLSFAKGEDEKTFALVVHNSTDQTRYFFAVPHTNHPGAGSMGLLFECLCNHHVYKVPAHYYWYRIVRLKAEPDDPNLKNLSSVTIDHQFVEVSEADVKKKYLSVLYEQDEDIKAEGKSK
ncbi:MAG TPA: hypothetical protein VF412_01540 [Bdellovibrio sp.]|uniref:hypothetical protein n=1 Tax=Bdellovibrio sp. TaxID=28201 RepID=UPI002EF96B7A